MFRLAAICLVAAMLALLLGTIGSMRAFDLVTLRAAPEAFFDVQAPGEWVLASETRGVRGGQSLVGEAIGVDRVTVRNPDGVSIPIREPDQTVRYHQTDREGVVIGMFDTTARGRYSLGVDGDPAVLLAVGPDPVGPVSIWVLISGSIAIVLLGVACCLGWIAFRSDRCRNPPF